MTAAEATYRAHNDSAAGLKQVRPSAARSVKRSGLLAIVLRRSIAPAFLIAVWQYASSAGWIDPSVLASPSQVWATFIELSRTGELVTHVAMSFERVMLGLAIGGSVAILLAVTAGLSRIGEDAIDPPLQMIRAMPSLGTAPLLVIWLGIDEGVKVGLVAIGVVFPLYINIYKGIRGIDRRYAELAQVCGATRRELLSSVIFPGALPSALVGLRLSLGIAWLSLVVGEGINAQGGIGYLVAQGRNALQTDWIILGLVLYAILGLLMEALVRLLEWRLLPWSRGFLK
jgi:sulfonate transport system permease protein